MASEEHNIALQWRAKSIMLNQQLAATLVQVKDLEAQIDALKKSGVPAPSAEQPKVP